MQGAHPRVRAPCRSQRRTREALGETQCTLQESEAHAREHWETPGLLTVLDPQNGQNGDFNFWTDYHGTC